MQVDERCAARLRAHEEPGRGPDENVERVIRGLSLRIVLRHRIGEGGVALEDREPFEDEAGMSSVVSDHRDALERLQCPAPWDSSSTALFPLRMSLALRGKTSHPTTLSGADWTEEDFLARLDAEQDSSDAGRFSFCLNKAILFALHAQYREAMPWLEEAKSKSEVAFSTLGLAQVPFWECLIVSGVYDEATSSERGKLKNKIVD